MWHNTTNCTHEHTAHHSGAETCMHIRPIGNSCRVMPCADETALSSSGGNGGGDYTTK